LDLGRQVFTLIVDIGIPLDELGLEEFNDFHRDYQRDWDKVGKKEHPGPKSNRTLPDDGVCKVACVTYLGHTQSKVLMIGLTYSEGPELVESSSNEADEELKDEDVDDLAIGLQLKFRKFGPRLTLILHYSGVMPRVHN
jgi:hypothetical protein